MAVKFISKFSSLNFDENWKNSFEKDICYIQKFALSDTIRFQIIWDDLGNLPQITLSQFTEETQSSWLLQPTGSYILTDQYTIYDYLVSNEITQAGRYNLEISNWGIAMASCDFCVYEKENEELENTIRISYRHDRNEFDTIFLKELESSSLTEDLYFDFRVEGGVLSGEKTPLADTENFRDQRYTEHQLSALPYLAKTLTVGDRQGVPDWVGEKLNLIFSLSHVQINGKSFTRKEGAIPEINPISSLYPLFVYKLEIEGEDPYKQEIEDPRYKLFLMELNVPANTSIQLPFYSSSSYPLNIDVYWGDGNSENFYFFNGLGSNAEMCTHTYKQAGTYTISITGSAAEMNSNREESAGITNFKNCLRAIVNWGTSLTLRSTGYAFRGCTNLTSLPADTTHHTFFQTTDSIIYCFYGCSKLTEIPVNTFKNARNVINATSVFQNCSSLKTTYSDLFSTMPQCTSFTYAFNACSALTSVPDHLFENCPLNTSFFGTFSRCTSLTTLGTNVFNNQHNVTTCHMMFYYCTRLTSLPAGIFDSFVSCTSFQLAFSNCTSLTTLPDNLYTNCSKVTDYSSCFTDCSKISSVGNIFGHNVNTINFGYVFSGCSAIRSVDENLFANCPNANIFTYALNKCSSLTSIPGLFKNCPLATGFNYTFYGCSSAKSIAADLFKQSTQATTFEYTFSQCSSLESIPNGLFDNCTSAKSYNHTFYGCTNLVSLPENLFRHPSIQTLQYTFYGCTSLKTIPKSLIKGATSVYSLKYMFWNCKSLESFTPELFNLGFTDINDSPITDVFGLFHGCSSITEIPENAFYYLPNIVTMEQTFHCTSRNLRIHKNAFPNQSKVTSINSCFGQLAGSNPNGYELIVPEGVFNSMINVMDAGSLFYNASIKQIPASLFDTMPELNSVASMFYSCIHLDSIPTGLFEKNHKITSYRYCFCSIEGANLSGSTPVSSIDGTKLWERVGGNYPATVNGASCFRYQTGLSDYNQIPDSWKE